MVLKILHLIPLLYDMKYKENKNNMMLLIS